MAGRKEKVVKGRAEWRKQNRVKSIRIGMTVVAVFLCFSIAAGALIAWLQIRKTVAGSRSGPSQAPQPVSSASSGLPVYSDSFSLLLVNSTNPLPAGYQPELAECEGVSVDTRIVPALKNLLQASRQAGCPLELTGGYVDAQKQSELYQAEVSRLMKNQKLSQVLAESQAQASVGKAGCSESQTGLAVTFSAAGVKKGGDFGSTAQYRWLVQNGVTYGFILRFPDNKASVTGVPFNPSRFRYVGTENAMKMREFSMCLEEYANYMNQQAG